MKCKKLIVRPLTTLVKRSKGRKIEKVLYLSQILPQIPWSKGRKIEKVLYLSQILPQIPWSKGRKVEKVQKFSQRYDPRPPNQLIERSIGLKSPGFKSNITPDPPGRKVGVRG